MTSLSARTALRLATVLAVPGLVAGCTADSPRNATTTGSVPRTSAGGGPGSGGFDAIPDLVQRAEPSVVTVFTGEGLGSGVVYRDGGIVVTNAHVVGEVRDVELGLVDGTRVRGRVEATDAVTDLAVIRAERPTLPPLPFQPRLPRVGELVIALGSPLGFENSASAGIVSGLGRSIPGSARETRALVDLIQTDASISPGNSGGALINGAGEVVGINEAYIPPAAGAVSLGFAIPAATVVDVIDELLEDGTASHAYLGVVPVQLTPEIARSLGLDTRAGVLVRGVADGGPAASAGIRAGDVLVRMGDRPIRTLEEFLGALRGLEPGQEAQVGVRRDGQDTTVAVTLGELRPPT